MLEYPEHAWEPWNFHQTPRYWAELTGRAFQSGDPVAQALTEFYLLGLAKSLDLPTINDLETTSEAFIPSTDLHRLKHFGGLKQSLKTLASPLRPVTPIQDLPNTALKQNRNTIKRRRKNGTIVQP